MFCPNCGAQNQDAATTCNKCGFNLKGSASPKFKGTMLMMNSGGAVPGAPGAPPPAAGGPAPGGPAPGGPAVSEPKPKLKGTMIGVAPPSGGPIGSGMGGPAPGGPMGGPPGGGAPMGAPGGGAPMGGPPGGGAPMGGPPGGGAPMGAPGGDVNPLGGTMVANAPPGYGYGGSSPMGGHMGAPHHDAGAPATMPQAGSSSMGGGHMGAPGGMAPMAGGHMGGGHMGAPGGMAPMGAPGGAAPMGAPGGAGMAPYAPPTGGSGMAGGKLFPEKSPVSVFFLTLVTCGIYAFFWYGGTKDAMEARGAEIGPIWHIFIPILGLIWVWKWCQGVEKVTNGQITATNALIRLWLLGAIGMAWLQSDFNSL